ncbi:hypothetical protein Tco_1471179, partial [Tanacetum coccineum]
KHLFQGRLLYSFWHKAIFFPPCKSSRSKTYVSASIKEIDYVQLGIVNQAELKLQPRVFFSFCTAAYTEVQGYQGGKISGSDMIRYGNVGCGKGIICRDIRKVIIFSKALRYFASWYKEFIIREGSVFIEVDFIILCA